MTIGERFSGFGSATRSLVQRFAASSRGNVAMMFALTLPVLVMIIVGGVDISRASTVRSNLQDALDAAALAAARSPAVTDADLKTIGDQALRANLAAYPDITLASSTYHLDKDQLVVAKATVNVKTLVANIVLPPYGKVLNDTLPVGAHSEVTRSSKNIEVALVLDITGSMAGSRLANLKSAARQLVNIVVQDVQTPYYTRMSIVPYSTGVNVGSHSVAARGLPIGPTTISNVIWTLDTGKAITGITRANPAVVKAPAHGLVTGDAVGITGVVGMTQINNKAYLVDWIDADSFKLKTLAGATVSTSSGYNAYTSGGTVKKCELKTCNLVITSNSHGLAATDPATGAVAMTRLTDIVGVTAFNGGATLNNKVFDIQRIDVDSFAIPVVGPTYTAYTSGGNAQCGSDGCQWRLYRNAPSNAVKAWEISTCATERVGAEKVSDAAPSSTAYVGRLYPNPDGSNTECPASDNAIQPLTHIKKDLNDLIDDLQANGYTAGQIGLAWGWYTVSPNFNGLWSGNTAGAYASRETLKAVILMTDGEFNASYCSGVLAKDADFGGVERVNCNATNGDPFDQAAALCVAIKSRSIIVYTVGFQIAKNGEAAKILKNCATSPEYAFLPASGADLTNDFAAIGRDITRLRISR